MRDSPRMCRQSGNTVVSARYTLAIPEVACLWPIARFVAMPAPAMAKELGYTEFLPVGAGRLSGGWGKNTLDSETLQRQTPSVSLALRGIYQKHRRNNVLAAVRSDDAESAEYVARGERP